MMLQSCYAVFATSILSSVEALTVFLLMLKWKKSFLLLGIKFCGHAKEEAKHQPATWTDFLTRKKLR